MSSSCRRIPPARGRGDAASARHPARGLHATPQQQSAPAGGSASHSVALRSCGMRISADSVPRSPRPRSRRRYIDCNESPAQIRALLIKSPSLSDNYSVSRMVSRYLGDTARGIALRCLRPGVQQAEGGGGRQGGGAGGELWRRAQIFAVRSSDVFARLIASQRTHPAHAVAQGAPHPSCAPAPAPAPHPRPGRTAPGPSEGDCRSRRGSRRVTHRC